MKSSYFYKIMAGCYDLLDVIYFRDYKNSPRKAVLENIDRQDKVLDLCTGTATNAIRISKEMPEIKMVGIDISRDMLRVAKEKIQDQHIENVKLYCMDATNMKFKNKCFDKVIISLVLHELDELLARKILFFPIHILEPKPYRTFIKKNLQEYFEKFDLEIVEKTHCDYSKVLKIKKRGKNDNHAAKIIISY